MNSNQTKKLMMLFYSPKALTRGNGIIPNAEIDFSA